MKAIMGKKFNKGFSLVELVVTIAILAFAGIGIIALFSMGVFNYRNNTEEVNLQYQSQLAANQMGNVILSAKNGMSFNSDTKTLEVYSSEEKDDDSVEKIIDTFTFRPDDTAIFYQETKDGVAVDAEEKFADCITDFDVVIRNKDGATIQTTDENNYASAASVEISLKYKNGERVYEETNVVTLRNEIDITTSVDAEADAKLQQFYGDNVLAKNPRVNNVEFVVNKANLYPWVGDYLYLAKGLVSEESKDGIVTSVGNSPDTVIGQINWNISNSKFTEDEKKLIWKYGNPTPNSDEGYKTIEEEKIPNYVVNGENILIKVGEDETSAFQMVGTSVLSSENTQRTKSDSVMIYPKYISNISIKQNPSDEPTAQEITLTLGITVKNPGPDAGKENDPVLARVKTALGNGDGATASGSTVDKLTLPEKAIAIWLTEIQGVEEEGKIVYKDTQNIKKITLSDLKDLDPEVGRDSITYKFEYTYDAKDDSYQKYICTAAGNTLGLSVDVENNKANVARANISLAIDPTKGKLEFKGNPSVTLLPGEPVTLAPIYTQGSTRTGNRIEYELGVGSAANQARLEIFATSKNGQSCDASEVIVDPSSIASNGKFEVKSGLTDQYTIVAKVHYKSLSQDITFRVEPVKMYILNSSGKQFITKTSDDPAKLTQKVEFMPTNKEVPVKIRLFRASDTTNKRPLDSSIYYLDKAIEGQEGVAATVTPVTGADGQDAGCKFSFANGGDSHLVFELCKKDVDGNPIRLGVFESLDIVTGDVNVGADDNVNWWHRCTDIYMPLDIRENLRYGGGLKLTEPYGKNGIRINVDYYYFYDIFGRSVGWNKGIKIAASANDTTGKAVIVVKESGKDNIWCYCWPANGVWILEGK